MADLLKTKQYCKYGGKVAYTSERQAIRARKTLAKMKRLRNLRIYRCPNCFKYHFTSSND